MNFLKLIRYQNLLLLALMQLLFRFGYLELIAIPLSLFYWQYSLLVAATVLIAAGGYVINAIFDQETATENQPKQALVGTFISESKAYTLYASLTITGVTCGFILSNSVNHPNFAVLFVLIATLLYFHASSLKQIAVLGNIVVALLVASSILIIGIFDIFPNTFEFNRAKMSIAFVILGYYAAFAFILNLAREIIKDIEDAQDDGSTSRPLAVIIGVRKTAKIASIILFLTAGFLMYYLNENLMPFELYISVSYILALVIAPLIFVAVMTWNATEKHQFHFVSTLLKWVLFFGIVSVTVLNLNIKHNA